MRSELRNPMRFVIFEEEEAFVAVCLEHYVGAQGSSMEEVKRRLQIAYRAELDETLASTGEPFGGIDPAPQRFQEMWSSPGVTRGHVFEKEEDRLELAA